MCPLTRTDEHARYDPSRVVDYFTAATQVALVLAAFRAPYRGRSTPVNAWWGSFDLAVNLFSGLPADPPSDDFIMRNAMDAQEVAIGWWPGDARYGKAAFYAYAHPAPDGFAASALSPPPLVGTPRWASTSWTGTTSARVPTRTRVALEFARSAFRHACMVCEWDPGWPPVRTATPLPSGNPRARRTRPGAGPGPPPSRSRRPARRSAAAASRPARRPACPTWRPPRSGGAAQRPRLPGASTRTTPRHSKASSMPMPSPTTPP